MNYYVKDIGKIKALCVLWSFPIEIIEKVFLGLGGDSMDEADEYLDLMDGMEVTNPAEAWKEWQRMHDLAHESNPFIL